MKYEITFTFFVGGKISFTFKCGQLYGAIITKGNTILNHV